MASICGDAHAVPGVVHVAFEVPDGSGAFGLGLSGRGPGAGHDLVLAGGQAHGSAEEAPDPGATVLEQLGLGPAPAAVSRDLDLRHAAAVAADRPALDAHGPGRNPSARLGRADRTS